MLLIHQGDAPDAIFGGRVARLSEGEQNAVYAAYKAINETPGVSPGVQRQPPETATTARVQEGRTPSGAGSPSLHADEPQDWPQLAALYGELARFTGSPVVELNRAAFARTPSGASSSGDSPSFRTDVRVGSRGAGRSRSGCSRSGSG